MKSIAIALSLATILAGCGGTPKNLPPLLGGQKQEAPPPDAIDQAISMTSSKVLGGDASAAPTPSVTPSPIPSPTVSPTPAPTPSTEPAVRSEGDVLADYGQPKPQSSPEPIQTQSTGAARFRATHFTYCTIGVKDCYSRLRNRPGMLPEKESLVAKLYNGDRVRYTGQSAYVDGVNWVTVVTENGQSGWIAAGVLRGLQ